VRAVVRFRTGAGDFAVPVDHVREVRSPKGMADLPAHIPGVAGLLRIDHEALTVLSVLGTGDRQVLVLQPGTRRFGVLVDEVTGVARIEDEAVGPAPPGQAEDLILGVVEIGDDLVLMLDAAALERRLDR